MNNDKSVRLETIEEIRMALKYEQETEGQIIPDVVFETLEMVKDRPYQELPPEVINEQTERD
jgi:hypothetical protein